MPGVAPGVVPEPDGLVVSPGIDGMGVGVGAGGSGAGGSSWCAFS